ARCQGLCIHSPCNGDSDQEGARLSRTWILRAMDNDKSFGEPSRVSGRLEHAVDARFNRPLTRLGSPILWRLRRRDGDARFPGNRTTTPDEPAPDHRSISFAFFSNISSHPKVSEAGIDFSRRNSSGVWPQ